LNKEQGILNNEEKRRLKREDRSEAASAYLLATRDALLTRNIEQGARSFE